ncbi:PhnA domain-containing protein [Bartonella fuyuanensis]
MKNSRLVDADHIIDYKILEIGQMSLKLAFVQKV